MTPFSLRRFLKDTDGMATLEFALWFPFICAFLMATLDLTTLFYTQQRLYDEAYGASRQVSLGLGTESDIEQALSTRLGTDRAYTVAIASADGYVTSRITVPYDDIMVFASIAMNGSLSSEATLWVENAGDGSQ